MTATQAPTPGPLTSESVKLLVKLMDTLKPFAEVAEKLKHCHVVEICEPTPENPSRNIIPMPREWFERAGDDLEYIAIQLHASGVLSEGQASKITGLDRVSVRREVDRLAPTAPVEASESEQLWSVGSWLSAALDDPKVCDAMKSDIRDWFDNGGHLRPQPSGETREDAEVLAMLDDYADRHIGATRGEDMSLEEMLISKARERLSARPLALGGQHSDGEVKWLVSVGSGPYGPRPFDNEAEALAYFEEEMAVPSYMGPGHRRHGGVTKVTTITEKVR